MRKSIRKQSKEWHQQYYKKNRAKILAQQTKYNKLHKEERNAYARRYYAKNKMKVRAKMRVYSAKYYRAHKKARA